MFICQRGRTTNRTLRRKYYERHSDKCNYFSHRVSRVYITNRIFYAEDAQTTKRHARDGLRNWKLCKRTSPIRCDTLCLNSISRSIIDYKGRTQSSSSFYLGARVDRPKIFYRVWCQQSQLLIHDEIPQIPFLFLWLFEFPVPNCSKSNGWATTLFDDARCKIKEKLIFESYIHTRMRTKEGWRELHMPKTYTFNNRFQDKPYNIISKNINAYFSVNRKRVFFYDLSLRAAMICNY